MPVLTIDENGDVSTGAVVEDFETRRLGVIPTINIGDEGGWLEYVMVDLLPETLAWWDRKLEVSIFAATFRPSNEEDPAPRWRKSQLPVLVQCAIEDASESTTALVVCYLPIVMDDEDRRLDGGTVHARGRIGGPLGRDSEEDDGKQIILTMTEGIPVTFELHDGGTATYLWTREDGLRKVENAATD
ncbi:MAG TPA: hypothetical protein VFT64_03975 [Rickettsiales bacterium]|nr:hypothetical protein [Rickettsiales bacterium]